MEGDEIDPCECYVENEFFMRRLLSMLRQSQSLCTDTECFVDSSSTQQSRSNESGDYFIVMTIILAMTYFLHYWLTQTRRNSISEPQKAPKSNSDSSRRPPTPPPPAC